MQTLIICPNPYALQLGVLKYSGMQQVWTFCCVESDYHDSRRFQDSTSGCGACVCVGGL